PDLVAAFGSPGAFTPNNVVTLLGTQSGFGFTRFYASQASGRLSIGSAPDSGSFVSVGSDPFLQITTFNIRSGGAVNNNLIVNGDFENVDLTREAGNLTGW